MRPPWSGPGADQYLPERRHDVVANVVKPTDPPTHPRQSLSCSTFSPRHFATGRRRGKEHEMKRMLRNWARLTTAAALAVAALATAGPARPWPPRRSGPSPDCSSSRSCPGPSASAGPDRAWPGRRWEADDVRVGSSSLWRPSSSTRPTRYRPGQPGPHRSIPPTCPTTHKKRPANVSDEEIRTCATKTILDHTVLDEGLARMDARQHRVEKLVGNALIGVERPLCRRLGAQPAVVATVAVITSAHVLDHAVGQPSVAHVVRRETAGQVTIIVTP